MSFVLSLTLSLTCGGAVLLHAPTHGRCARAPRIFLGAFWCSVLLSCLAISSLCCLVLFRVFSLLSLLSFLFANVSAITLTVTLTLTLTCVGAVLLPAPTHGLHFLEPGQSLSAPLCR